MKPAHMHRLLLVVALVTLVPTPSFGQASPAKQPASESTVPPPFSDNSFLVEEAYNQERGVVQHIVNVRRARDGTFLFTLTQEWPAPALKHQVSYTVSVLGGGETRSGIGDLLLHYRYQLLGKDEERVWFAPRVSAILPTGNVAQGRGTGGPGIQIGLPLSIRVSDAVVTHWNAGATLSRARAVNGVRETTHGRSAAASAIWLLSPTFHLMLETAWEHGELLDGVGIRSTEESFVISPGVRMAINMRSGMQIVPGFGVPIGFGMSRGERDLFFYLSVEHPFKRAR